MWNRCDARSATPRHFLQLTPTFVTTASTGSFNPLTAGTTPAQQSASWNYGFGTNPAAVAVSAMVPAFAPLRDHMECWVSWSPAERPLGALST